MKMTMRSEADDELEKTAQNGLMDRDGWNERRNQSTNQQTNKVRVDLVQFVPEERQGLQRARSNFMGVPIEAKEKLKKQHMLWWRCGCHADHHKRKEDPTEEHGSSMFLGIISAILLLNAIYVGTFIFWILAGSGYPLVKHFEPEESSSLPVRKISLALGRTKLTALARRFGGNRWC